jgi:hypothetical protein
MPRRLLLAALLAFQPTQGIPQTVQKCAAPIPVPQTVTTPNSTYYSNGEPPARFAHIPNVVLHIRYGQQAINDLCGRPPCGMMFLGCTSGTNMALPDPFSMDGEQFARIVRHEIGHLNGWPATHGA